MRIRALTGIRSDYDLMEPIFRLLADDQVYEFGLIVCGAHLSKNHGETINEIMDDSFQIVYRITSLISSDLPEGRLKGLSVQLASLTDFLVNDRPDCLMVLGDREEAIVAALAGAYLGIPVIHFAGGDRVVGNVDDQIRHSVTRLAHLHFTFSQDSAERLIRMGEQAERVRNIGNPGIDRLLRTPHMSRKSICEYLGIAKDAHFCVLLQHVISSEFEQGEFQMEQTLLALSSLEHDIIIIRPNSDAGSGGINSSIDNWKERSPKIKVFDHLPRYQFVNLLRHADFLIGNSSLGILEAPALKLPVINVGNRQKGRLHSENIIFVEHDEEAIRSKIQVVLNDPEFRTQVENCSQPYGDGNAAIRCLNAMSELLMMDDLLVKDITY